MKIVKICATVLHLLRGVAGTGQCKDVCEEYERNFERCWTPYGEGNCELIGYCQYSDYKKFCDGQCSAGDWGACVRIKNLGFTYLYWCPGMSSCNIIGCDCKPCQGCNHNAAFTEGLADVPDSEDGHKWYTGLSNQEQEKLAHLNEVVCQKHGYGDATSFGLVEEIDDRMDANLIDEDEKTKNGGKDDGAISHEEFKDAYFDVDDLAKKYRSHPIGGKNGKKNKSV